MPEAPRPANRVDPEVDTHSALRAWARGVYATAAAVELLCRAFDGRLASDTQPWIVADPTGGWRVDKEALEVKHLGAHSGGEFIVLRAAGALLGGELFDLSAVAHLDRHHQDLLLAAIAHAGGSHQDMGLQPDPFGKYRDQGTGQRSSLTLLGSLHPWPQVE